MSAFDTGLASAIFGGINAGTAARRTGLQEEVFDFEKLQQLQQAQQAEAELRQAEQFLSTEFDRFNPTPLTEQFPTTPEGLPASGPPIQFEDQSDPSLIAERSRFDAQPFSQRQQEIGVLQDFEMEQRVEEQLKRVREENVLKQAVQIERSGAPREDKDRAISALIQESKDLSAASRLKMFGDQAFPQEPSELSGQQVSQLGTEFGLDPNTSALLGFQAQTAGGLTQSSLSQALKGATAGIEQNIVVLKSIADRDADSAKQALQAWTNIVNSGSGDPDSAKREADRLGSLALKSANAKIEGERQLAEALAVDYNADVLASQAQIDPSRQPPTDLTQTALSSDGSPTFGPEIPQTASVAPPAVSGDARSTPDGSSPGGVGPGAIRFAPELSQGHTNLGLIVLDGPRGPVAVNRRQIEQSALQAAQEFRQTHGREPTAAEVEVRAMELVYGG